MGVSSQQHRAVTGLWQCARPRTVASHASWTCPSACLLLLLLQLLLALAARTFFLAAKKLFTLLAGCSILDVSTFLCVFHALPFASGVPIGHSKESSEVPTLLQLLFPLLLLPVLLIVLPHDQPGQAADINKKCSCCDGSKEEEDEEAVVEEDGRAARDSNIEVFLTGAGCSKYLKLFLDNKVTTDLLPDMSKEDFKALGVGAFGDVLRLFKASQTLTSAAAQWSEKDHHTAAELRMLIENDSKERGAIGADTRGELHRSGPDLCEDAETETVISEEIVKANLGFELDHFQMIALKSLAYSKHVVLSVPTGAGKMIVSFLSHQILKKVKSCPHGVTIIMFPLSDLINEVIKTCPFGLTIGFIKMSGAVEVDSESNISMSHKIEDMCSGRISVLVGHPESFSSPAGCQILDSLQEKNLIMQLVVDEAHTGLTSQWAGSFRNGMLSAPARVRVKCQEDAPVLAMSATLTKRDTSELMSSLDLSESKTVLIRENPVLSNIKYSKYLCPSRFDGHIDSKFVYQEGSLDLLKIIALDNFIKNIRNGTPNQNMLIFCFLKDAIKINNYLNEELSYFATNEKNTPWVLNYADKGPRSKENLRKRLKDGSLPLIISTHCMLFGLNLKNIETVIMLKPFSNLSDFLQAAGRAGRRSCDNTRKKCSFYLLYSKRDLASRYVTEEVKEFVKSTSCLKQKLSHHFNYTMECEGNWCSSNCDVL